MSELTEDQIVKAADILRADEEARYAQTWLWNGADTDYVQDLYFKGIIRLTPVIHFAFSLTACRLRRRADLDFGFGR